MSALLEQLSKLSPEEREALWARVNAMLPVFRNAVEKGRAWRARWGVVQTGELTNTEVKP